MRLLEEAVVRGRRASASRPPLPALAVALVMLLMPFGDIEVAGLSVVYLAMTLPAALALAALVRDQQPVPASLILLGLGLGVVVSLVAAAGGVNPGDAITRVVIGFIALGYAAGVALAHRPGLERGATDLLVLVGGALSAMALTEAGSLSSSTSGWVVDGRLTGVFAQPNELGMFCAALLPVAVACIVTSRSRRHAAVLGVATIAIVLAWLLSMSRGAWIGGAVALLCLAVLEPRSRRILQGAGAALGTAGVLALTLPSSTPLVGILGARLRSLGDPGDNEYDARPLIWGEAWRQATERPWFGVGPDGYRIAATDSVSTVSSYGAEHPHDLYLTVLVERGVLGLAAGALVVLGCFLAARRHAQHARIGRTARTGRSTELDPAATLHTRSVAVLAALVAVAIHGVFDLPLRNPIVAGFVWTLLGMAVVAETTSRTGPRSSAWNTSRTPQQQGIGS